MVRELGYGVDEERVIIAPSCGDLKSEDHNQPVGTSDDVRSLRDVAPHVIGALEYLAETRSFSVLSALLEKVADYVVRETDAKMRQRFSRLIEFSNIGREIELLYGKDCLLDLNHPGILHSIELGIIKREDVERIRALQKALPSSVMSLRYVDR